MPHISKENIFELASMSNEVKAYLQRLYPELFEYEYPEEEYKVLHYETHLEKAKRLYKKGTTIKGLIHNVNLTFEKEPVFKYRNGVTKIYDVVSGYIVFIHNWAEIIEL